MHRALLFWVAIAVLIAPAGYAEQQCEVLAVDIDGAIHPITPGILRSAVSQAERDNCHLVLIRMNTPGGLATATRSAIEVMLSSRAPVAVWVGPTGVRAASAGFFLLQAADVAAMAPGTHTGAAHPVMLVGTPDPVMMKKIENDAAAELRSIVGRRHRNIALAEKAVLESRSFSDREALDNGLIDLIAPDRDSLLKQLHGREVTRFDGRTSRLDLSSRAVRPYEMTIRQRVQSALSDPSLALSFILLGLLGIYLEFSSPGLFVPGAAGALLLLLGLSALAVLPVNWTGAALLLLAISLFILEAKFTSHGVLGGAGVAAMVLGATMLIDAPVPELRIPLQSAVVLTAPFALILVFLTALVVRARRARSSCGPEAAPGQLAVALTALTPHGRVLFHGELWNAHASTPIEAETDVRVKAIHGLELEVEPATAPGPVVRKAQTGG